MKPPVPPPQAVRVRPAVPSDHPAIERIVNAAYAPYIPRIGQPPGPMRDDYAARIEAGTVWVLEEPGAIAGVLVLIPAPDHLLLDNIAVAPDRQGKGLGARLLAFAEEQAARRGLPELRLYTHALMTENQALYRRFGWAEYARATEAGYDRAFMRKRIAA